MNGQDKEKITMLNKACHRANTPDIMPTLFDDLEPVIPDPEYGDFWYMSDLHNILATSIPAPSYDTAKKTVTAFAFPYIKKHTWNAGTVLPPLFDHMKMETRTYTLHYPSVHVPPRTKHNAEDVRLSRFACWGLTCHPNGDMLGRTYFITPGASPEQIVADANEFSRIPWRTTASTYQQRINGTIYSRDKRVALYKSMITKYFFGGMSAEQVKEQNHLPQYDRDPLTNYMPLEMLRIYSEALTRITNTYIPRTGNNPAAAISYILSIIEQEMTSARQEFIMTGGQAPENALSPIPVQQIEKIFKRREREFWNNYVFTKIK